MIKNKPLVSVIIVSYNTAELTVKCIQSVYASKGFKKGEIEVIVVDNGSTDDTIGAIGRSFESFRLIANQENKGFGGGNNQGAEIARGQYLLFLNTDAFVERDTLSTLVDVLAKRQSIVSVGPQLRYADGSLQLSGGYLPTPSRVMAWMWGLDKLPLIKKLFPTPYHVFDPSWHERAQYPEWLMGACILFRKDQFLSIGGFDDKIFMYSEEVELYHRLKTSLDKSVYFTPKTHVTHSQRASSNQADTRVLIQELKGVEYYYLKYYPNLLWLIQFVIVVGVLLRIAVFSFMPSRSSSLAEYKNYFKKS